MNEPSTSSTSTNGLFPALGNNPALSLVIIIGIIPLIAILYWGLGELLFLLFGVNCLPTLVIGRFQQRTATSSPTETRDEAGLSNDLELIRQEEVESQKRLEELKQERREKYRKFFEPYCKVRHGSYP
jgi:hypothetical protein